MCSRLRNVLGQTPKGLLQGIAIRSASVHLGALFDESSVFSCRVGVVIPFLFFGPSCYHSPYEVVLLLFTSCVE